MWKFRFLYQIAVVVVDVHFYWRLKLKIELKLLFCALIFWLVFNLPPPILLERKQIEWTPEDKCLSKRWEGKDDREKLMPSFVGGKKLRDETTGKFLFSLFIKVRAVKMFQITVGKMIFYCFSFVFCFFTSRILRIFSLSLSFSRLTWKSMSIVKKKG